MRKKQKPASTVKEKKRERLKSREENDIGRERTGERKKTGEKRKTTPRRDRETEWLTEKQNEVETWSLSETGMEATEAETLKERGKGRWTTVRQIGTEKSETTGNRQGRGTETHSRATCREGPLITPRAWGSQ